MIDREAAIVTNEQRDVITRLRGEGKSYAEIAQETGVARSTISTYCQTKCLIKPAIRGNTVDTKKPERLAEQRVEVIRVFADEPDETAISDVLGMLMNAR